MRLNFIKFISIFIIVLIVLCFLASQEIVTFSSNDPEIQEILNKYKKKRIETNNISKILFLLSIVLMTTITQGYFETSHVIAIAKIGTLVLHLLSPETFIFTGIILAFPVIDLKIPILEITSLIILLSPSTPEQIEIVKILKKVFIDVSYEILEEDEFDHTQYLSRIFEKFNKECTVDLDLISNRELKFWFKYVYNWFLTTEICTDLNAHLLEISEIENALQKIAENFRADSEE